ncbi:MAG: TldD/PmbA family protein [Sulfolobaceae archaeon]
MPNLEDILKKAEAVSKFAEVRYHKNVRSSIELVNGSLVSVEDRKTSGFSLRYFRDGVIYFQASSSIDDLNPFSARLRGWEEGYVEGRSIIKEYEVKQKINFSDISLDEKIKILKEIYKDAISLKLKGNLISLSLSYLESIEEKEYLNSEGSRVKSRVPRIWFYFSFVIKNGDRTATVWSDDLGASGGFELLQEWNVREYVMNEIIKVDKVLDRARSLSPTLTDVVVSSKIAGIIAHESTGHPFEADRVLGREAAQAGKSYLSVMKISEIGSNVVNLVDDPTLENSMGFFLVDDEGIEARRKFLIKEGKVNELLHNRFTAYKYGVKSNGSSRAMDYESEPIIRMSNTFFLPSNIKFEELLEGVKKGVYLESYMEWNIDDIRWGQRYVGLKAYEIVNGEIRDPILFPVLEITTGELYKAIDAVDNQLRFYAGLCGKGEPMQGVPVWMGGPNMRLRNVRIKRLGE